MSFQQGLSGLNAASKQLDAIGNNVANANTVGFKSSQVQFADIYANSISGGGASAGQIGIGVKVAGVAQQFTQGNISSSSNALDVAINGGGFFRLSNNGTISYSRNGQFQLDREGFIVNNNGLRVTGYTANTAGVLSTGAATDIQIDTSDQTPNETTSIEAVLNLDSRKPPITAAFDINDPATYHDANSVTVYDSLGNSHVMQTFFVKTAASTWDVYASMDGALLPAPVGGNIGTLTFDAYGALTAGMPLAGIQLPVTTGAQSPIGGGIDLDFTGTTQFGSIFGVNSLVQDGFASGRLSGFSIGEDGVISGRYTNGLTRPLGQVVLANFANPNGLRPLGDNLWAATHTSGAELVGRPGSSSLGQLQSSSTEDSNVDLTAELVNMITAQRYYQANAQTIKTQDQVMQTLVNLR